MENKFEDKLKRLEEIAALMESKKLSLEDNLNLFKEGSALIKELENTLKDAEKSIKEVIEIEE